MLHHFYTQGVPDADEVVSEAHLILSLQDLTSIPEAYRSWVTELFRVRSRIESDEDCRLILASALERLESTNEGGSIFPRPRERLSPGHAPHSVHRDAGHSEIVPRTHSASIPRPLNDRRRGVLTATDDSYDALRRHEPARMGIENTMSPPELPSALCPAQDYALLMQYVSEIRSTVFTVNETHVITCLLLSATANRAIIVESPFRAAVAAVLQRFRQYCDTEFRGTSERLLEAISLFDLPSVLRTEDSPFVPSGPARTAVDWLRTIRETRTRIAIAVEQEQNRWSESVEAPDETRQMLLQQGLATLRTLDCIIAWLEAEVYVPR
jgi:hypothetical protein